MKTVRKSYQSNFQHEHLKVWENTFADGKCVREHLQVQVNTFADDKCVREHLQLGEAAVAGAPNDP